MTDLRRDEKTILKNGLVLAWWFLVCSARRVRLEVVFANVLTGVLKITNVERLDMRRDVQVRFINLIPMHFFHKSLHTL